MSLQAHVPATLVRDEPVTVQTVLGPVPSSELGMTLPHEHLFNDLSEALYPGVRSFSAALADAVVTPELAWLLREDPYACADNCGFDERDLETVVAELAVF